MLKIEFPTLNFDLVPVTIALFFYSLTTYQIYPFLFYYTAWIWLTKKPKYLVVGFISKYKFCLTDKFIGLLLLCYITITTNTTTNITDTMADTLPARYRTLVLSFERNKMLSY
jgi:hypothetical protein